jgi:hypothetical protein
MINNPKISKNDVILKIRNVLRDPEYTGGTKGKLVYYISQTQKTYFIRISDIY